MFWSLEHHLLSPGVGAILTGLSLLSVSLYREPESVLLLLAAAVQGAKMASDFLSRPLLQAQQSQAPELFRSLHFLAVMVGTQFQLSLSQPLLHCPERGKSVAWLGDCGFWRRRLGHPSPQASWFLAAHSQLLLSVVSVAKYDLRH